MTQNTIHRRRLVACLALGAACVALPALSGAQTTQPAPAPGGYRRRRRDTSSFLIIGGIVAAIAAWVFIGGKRARKKELARQDMEARLARARERSKNL